MLSSLNKIDSFINSKTKKKHIKYLWFVIILLLITSASALTYCASFQNACFSGNISVKERAEITKKIKEVSTQKGIKPITIHNKLKKIYNYYSINDINKKQYKEIIKVLDKELKDLE